MPLYMVYPHAGNGTPPHIVEGRQMVIVRRTWYVCHIYRSVSNTNTLELADMSSHAECVVIATTYSGGGRTFEFIH